MVEVRGTVHWLTHADGPARALSVDPAARARLPRVLGTTGKVAWVTDAERAADAHRRSRGDRRGARPRRRPGTLAAGAARQRQRPRAVAGRDQARRRRARRPAAARRRRVRRGHRARRQRRRRHRGRLLVAGLGVAGLGAAGAAAAGADQAGAGRGPVHRGRDRRPVRRQRPGLHRATGCTWRSCPGAPSTRSTTRTRSTCRSRSAPARTWCRWPRTRCRRSARCPAAVRSARGRIQRILRRNVRRLTVDTDGISSRVVAVPVDEARYYSLAAVKGGLVWLRSRLSGVLGEGVADLDEDRPRPALERFDLRKREASVLAGEVELVRGQRRRRAARASATARQRARRRRPTARRQRLVRRRGHRGPVPGAVPRRPGGAVGARVRGGRAAAAPGLLDAGHVGAWTGTGCSTTTGSCSSGSARRPSSATCSGRSPPNSARRTPTSCRRARSPRAARPAARPRRCSAPTWPARPDGRWLVERVLPGESSDPHARSPFAAPGVAVRRGRRDPRGRRPPGRPGLRPVAGPGRQRRASRWS